jgi:hypothetical protein
MGRETFNLMRVGTLWSSGEHSVIFGRSRFQISARIPVILTKVFRCFRKSLQANAGIVLH